MRFHFQKKPVDLHACLLYTFAITLILLVTLRGNSLAIVLTLFVPGYLMLAALFPRDGDFDWIERFVLSFALSLGVVPLLVLILNFTPFGMGFVPIIGALNLFMALVAISAYWRRLKLPVEQRLYMTINVAPPAWSEYNSFDKALIVALAASTVIATSVVAYVVVAPPPRETFTEFYILGPGGNASYYPINLTASQTERIILGIANHETAVVNYTVRVDLVGVWIVYNVTTGFNDTVEVNRTTWSWLNITLVDGQNWTQPYAFRIDFVGLWKVQFLLAKNDDFLSPYRETHLFVRVS